MTLTPGEFPIKANETAAVVDAVYQASEGREPVDAVRARLGAGLFSLELSSLRPFPGSLTRDPARTSTYYLAADAVSGPCAGSRSEP